MPTYDYALDTDSGGVASLAASAVDATSLRFEVKSNMSFWINVDYSNPTSATRLLVAGDLVDTNDQGTIDILTLAPEISYVGLTPAP